MTNPNNAVGTNGAFGGRTSVNAFNDGLAAYSAGILSGWACESDSGLTVVLGGDGNTRDVAIAEDNAGNKTTINNISGSPISVTVGNAPNSNSRIDSIVAYVDNPPTGVNNVTDNYGACGLIVVSGTVASTPVAPNESTIRTAITSDGGSGTTAYYVVLANVTIPSGTTDLTSSNIKAGDISGLLKNSFSLTEINTGTKWIDGKDIFKITLQNTLSGSVNEVDVSALNIDLLIDWKNTIVASSGQTVAGVRVGGSGSQDFLAAWGYLMQAVQYTPSTNKIKFEFGGNFTESKTVYSTLYYTKTI